MNASIYNGISGLTSFQKGLDVESNNIANVNTVGFKSNTISFADIMYQKGVGKGSTMSDTIKDFGQGTLTQAQSNYDFAIKGDGFFTVDSAINPGQTFYTRAGNFNMGSDGFLKNIEDFNILGVAPVITGDQITSNFTELVGSSIIEDNLTLKTVNTFITNYSAVDTGVSGTNFKTAQSNTEDIKALSLAYQNALSAYALNIQPGTAATTQQNTVTFNAGLIIEPSSLEIRVNGAKYQQDFDTDAQTTLELFADKISSANAITASVDTATGIVTIDSIIPGQKNSIIEATQNTVTVAMVETATAAGDGQALLDTVFNTLKTKVETQGGLVATNQSEITKLISNTSPTFEKIQLNMEILGVSEDFFGELESDNGNLYIKQGEAKYIVGQISPVVFIDNTSLKPEGDNLYSKTENSGDPKYVKGISSVKSNVLEVSTSSLSEGLVNLMVFQRAYEANSKSVTTSDEFLKTAINLKK